MWHLEPQHSLASLARVARFARSNKGAQYRKTILLKLPPKLPQTEFANAQLANTTIGKTIIARSTFTEAKFANTHAAKAKSAEVTRAKPILLLFCFC